MKPRSRPSAGLTSWARLSRLWVISWIAIALPACTTPPTLPETEPPPFVEAATVTPVNRCTWPEPREAAGGYLFTPEQFTQIIVCKEAEGTNHIIAQENATAAESARDAYTKLRQSFTQQREYADYLLAREHDKRRDQWIEAQGYKAGLLIVAIASIL